MKKSFKIRLFLQLILVSALIVLFGRVVAQHYLTDQLQKNIHQQMGLALTTCAKHFETQDVFVNCFKSIDKGSLISNVSDFYVLCQRDKNHTRPHTSNDCSALLADANFWLSDNTSMQGDLQASSGFVEQQNWYAVRFLDDHLGREVWLDAREIDKIMKRLWALRDRNLIYVLPAILALLSLLTFYIVYVVMRPVKLIQDKMTELTANSLDQSISLQAPFKEFETLAKVFDDLRFRLNDSFTKARRFASDASHELRTPLTILRGNAERLMNDLPKGSDAQIRVRSMSDEVERLIEITEKLLLLSRADANSLKQELTNVNLSTLLAQLISDARSFQTHLKISSHLDSDVHWCCDKVLISQLIHNLYTNAVNYNISKGWVHITLEKYNGTFRLTLENTTLNQSEDLSDRAFERFYRGDASHARHIDGLGLGLSICKEIAKLHNADLSLTVTKNQTVVVALSASLSSST